MKSSDTPRPSVPRIERLERAIAAAFPTWALRREEARRVLAVYEAAKPNKLRKFHRDPLSPDGLVRQGAVDMRAQVRWFERNYDIVRGAIDTHVVNVVGPNGIGVEFAPRRADGSIDQDYGAALSDAWEEFQRRPEVTWQRDWQGVQRLMERTAFRDGEAFCQELLGPVPALDHGKRVPYSLELIEPDLLPMHFDDLGRNIRQAVECNDWGRPRRYWLFRHHPLEGYPGSFSFGDQDLKQIPADRMLHVAFRDRIGQRRGVTPFASAIERIEDIRDYEHSERIAAKVAASITGYVKRHAPDGGGYEGPLKDENGQDIPRELRLVPGAIIDTLAVGEEIGLVDPTRPNPNLVAFRNGQLRAFCAALGATFSSVAKTYDGTYSAQRQELVEGYLHYATRTDDFIGDYVRPVVERFIRVCDLSGTVRRPRGLGQNLAEDVLYIAPNMPWIDPLKEALGWLNLVQAGFASEVEVIRKRGQSPSQLLTQVQEWRAKTKAAGLSFSSEHQPKASAQAPEADREDDDEQAPAGRRRAAA